MDFAERVERVVRPIVDDVISFYITDDRASEKTIDLSALYHRISLLERSIILGRAINYLRGSL